MKILKKLKTNNKKILLFLTLAILINNSFSIPREVEAQSQTEILYGHYPNSGFTSEINGYNTWANSVGISKLSIGATFVSIDDSYNMGIYISDYSSHNAVPFINIMPNPNNLVCNEMSSQVR